MKTTPVPPFASPRTVRALILDFDGTILDTETLEYDVWRDIYREYGQEIPLQQWMDSIGRGNEQEKFSPYADLAARTGLDIDRDMLRAARYKAFDEGLMTMPARPGVISYLDDARRRGLQVGLATSSNRQWVMPHLERLDLLPRFGAVFTSDDVARTKPDPELYVSVCAALGVEPRDAIAIEDSPNGAQAALTAGLFTVIVPNTITRHLTFPKPDLYLDSLDEMPLGDLIPLAQGNEAVSESGV